MNASLEPITAERCVVRDTASRQGRHLSVVPGKTAARHLHIRDYLPIAHAGLERQQVWQTDLTRPGMAFRIQSLLIEFGNWQGYLDCLGVRYSEVASPSWRAEFKIFRGKGLWKGNALALARQKWPDAPLKREKDRDTACAVLIAEYVRLKNAYLAG